MVFSLVGDGVSVRGQRVMPRDFALERKYSSGENKSARFEVAENLANMSRRTIKFGVAESSGGQSRGVDRRWEFWGEM